MNEKDCAAAYQELVEILNEHELGWIAEKVARLIEEGKTSLNYPEWRTDPHLDFEEFTAREQLFILIDNIEYAVVEPVAIAGEVSEFLISQGLEPKIIRSNGKTETVKDLRPEIVKPQVQNALELKEFLEELRQDALNNAAA